MPLCKGKKLARTFFTRPTLIVAKELLGAEFNFRNCAGIITETEAYLGANDPASHAFRGKTQRNAGMFGPPGHAYVYFTYGKYFCLNFVTEPENCGAAVLLRSILPISGAAQMRARRQRATQNWPAKNLTNGPAKICQACEINLAQNGLDLCAPNSVMFIRARCSQPKFEQTPRIGIRFGREKLWRFVLKV